MIFDPINDILDSVAFCLVSGLYDQDQAQMIVHSEVRDYYKSLDKRGKLDTLKEWDASSVDELVWATTSELADRLID